MLLPPTTTVPTLSAGDTSAYLESIRAKVDRYGHAVQQVAAEGQPGWSYTVGLHAAGLPELIIVGGLPVAEQGSILNRLAARVRGRDSPCR